MPRYTIRRNGNILGTYAGVSEEEALDALAKDEGCASFKEVCAKLKMKRDDHKVEEIKE